jgi:hypothetical protein
LFESSFKDFETKERLHKSFGSKKKQMEAKSSFGRKRIKSISKNKNTLRFGLRVSNIKKMKKDQKIKKENIWSECVSFSSFLFFFFCLFVFFKIIWNF